MSTVTKPVKIRGKIIPPPNPRKNCGREDSHCKRCNLLCHLRNKLTEK